MKLMTWPVIERIRDSPLWDRKNVSFSKYFTQTADVAIISKFTQGARGRLVGEVCDASLMSCSKLARNNQCQRIGSYFLACMYGSTTDRVKDQKAENRVLSTQAENHTILISEMVIDLN